MDDRSKTESVIGMGQNMQHYDHDVVERGKVRKRKKKAVEGVPEQIRSYATVGGGKYSLVRQDALCRYRRFWTSSRYAGSARRGRAKGREGHCEANRGGMRVAQ